MDIALPPPGLTKKRGQALVTRQAAQIFPTKSGVTLGANSDKNGAMSMTNVPPDRKGLSRQVERWHYNNIHRHNADAGRLPRSYIWREQARKAFAPPRTRAEGRTGTHSPARKRSCGAGGGTGSGARGRCRRGLVPLAPTTGTPPMTASAKNAHGRCGGRRGRIAEDGEERGVYAAGEDRASAPRTAPGRTKNALGVDAQDGGGGVSDPTSLPPARDSRPPIQDARHRAEPGCVSSSPRDREESRRAARGSKAGYMSLRGAWAVLREALSIPVLHLVGVTRVTCDARHGTATPASCAPLFLSTKSHQLNCARRRYL
ncbi:hypothetical protein C8J57DRAFT_1466642 [Mycena rebaudengoi]|nr:hypothetical protein C8J57DRAFT_1466642 [Mycena rebaudengoi]